MALENLDSFNERRLSKYPNAPRRNGVACPDCGAELYDSAPNETLASNPPQKSIHCNECGFIGDRVA